MPTHDSDHLDRQDEATPAGPAAVTAGAGSVDLPMTGISRTGDRANPLRRFLRTEAASAGILMASVLIAVAWANISPASYGQVWHTAISAQLGPWRGSASSQEVVNQGLMTLFFLVVGLEARREFDLGDLRERRKAGLPLLLGVAGMLIPVGVFTAVNTGTIAMGGWGAAMSTDTALSLGALTVLGRAMPVRVRAFLLTVLVVDDIVALLVIAVVYSTDVFALPVAVAGVAFVAYTLTQRLPAQGRQHVRAILALTIWAGLLKGGVDPVVAGLLIGLATSAHTPSRGSLEEATAMVRRFRERPVPELAHTAIGSLTASLSINTRLQYQLHPWTSRVVVPAFALANAGVSVSWSSITQAAHSPVAAGIVLAYVVGKPVAIGGGAWVLSKFAPVSLRPHVGVGAALGTGTAAGIGLTVSLLVANLAFVGADLQNAKLAVLTAAALSATLTWAVFRALGALPETARVVAVHGTGREAVDLVEEPDNELDHILGPINAAVTVVEYGDFECGWTARSLPTTTELIGGPPGHQVRVASSAAHRRAPPCRARR